jgi:DNA modification methylase
MKFNEIHCGDCLDLMRQMPDNAFDWVITDPPYGMNVGKAALPDRPNTPIYGKAVATKRYYGACEWDIDRPSPDCFNEILRVSGHQIIFGGNFFADLLPPSRCWLTWDKVSRNNFADCELAWTSLDQPARVCTFLYSGCMMADRRGNERVHPTQKPLQVMEWIIKRFTEEGQTILDPFCGSGTTLTAAENLARKWVGIDIDPHWCEVSKRRTAQRGLFTQAHTDKPRADAPRAVDRTPLPPDH